MNYFLNRHSRAKGNLRPAWFSAIARAFIVEALEPRLQLSGTVTVTANGIGVANDTSDGAQPVAFGAASQGSAGASKIITVTNASGVDNLEVDINPSSDGAPDFTISTQTLTLAASGGNASQSFTVSLDTSNVGVHVELIKMTLRLPDGTSGFNFPISGTIIPADLGAVGSSTVTSHGVVTAEDNQDTLGHPRASVTNQFARFELGAPSNLVTLGVGTAHATEASQLMDLGVQVLPAPNGATQPDGTQTPLFSQTLVTNDGNGNANSLSHQISLPAGAYFVSLNAADLNSATFEGVDTETYTLTLSSVALNPGIALSFGGHPINDGDTATSALNGTDLGSAGQGAAAPVSTFTITNTGDGDLTLGSPTFGTGAFDVEQAPPSTLAPGASGTFQIALLTNLAGVHADTVSLPTNANGGNAFTFAVTGTVIAAAGPSLEVLDGGQQISNGQGTSINFGTAAAGAPGPTQTFTVLNNGTAALTTHGLSVPTGFTIVNALPASIAAGTSGSFTVRLDTSVGGNPSGQITFASNDANALNFAFPVSGTVTGTSVDSLGVTRVTSLKIPASVVGGQKTSKGTALVTLKNLSGAVLPGSATVTVFASPVSGAVGDGSLTLGHAAARLKLKSGQSQVVKVNISIPSVSADGTFFVTAQVTGAGVTSPSGVIGSAANSVTIRKPFVSLQGPGAAGGLSATRGRPLTFSLLLSNQGDVAATGAVSLDLLLSTDGTVGTSTPLTTLGQKINLKPNAKKALKLKATIPSSASAGSFVLLVRLRANGPLAALNLLDGQVIASFPITIA